MVRLVRSKQGAREKALKRAEERRKRQRPLAQRTAEGRSTRTDETDQTGEGQEEEEKEKHLEVHVPRLVTNEQGGLSGENFSQLACEILKFLLYMRGQLPDMYDTMVQSNLESQNNNRKRNLKFARFHSKVEKVLQCLCQPHLFVPPTDNTEVLRREIEIEGGASSSSSTKSVFACEVLYLFGSSVRRPIEAFLVRSAETVQSQNGSSLASDLRRSGFLAKVNRKLVTAIMAMETSAADEEEDNDDGGSGRRTIRNKNRRKKKKKLPKNCKAHVLVRTTPSVRCSSIGDTDGDGSDPTTTTKIKPPPPLEKKGFFPQIGVNIKRIKPIVIELCKEKREMESRPVDAGLGLDSESMVSQWYQCSTCIRGIR
jgi:hypothetical protein